MLWRSVLTVIGACSLTLAMVWLLRARLGQGWRAAFICTLIILGTVLWAVTELLSALQWIALPMVSAAWTIVWLAGAWLFVRAMLAHQRHRMICRGGRFWEGITTMPSEQLIIVGFVVLASLILMAVAVTAAPNTWDSLTYHLSRVMHWEQNRTLRFYPTAIERQLSFGPLAEMAILNLQILAGEDRLANVVQFVAMLGCLAGSSLIAEKLGGGRPAQLLAALATLTLPMGILQATSTQTDYVAALWCTCFVVVTDRQPPFNHWIERDILIGAALGLSFITKLTSAIFLVPFLLWHALRLFGERQWLAWKPLILMTGTAAIIAAPHAWRNFSTYGNLLGITGGPEQEPLLNASFDQSIMFSNAVRNIGSQLGTPSAEWNRIVEAGVSRLHREIGVDVNDPRSTWPGAQYQVISEQHEDSEGNPFHLALLAATIILMVRGATRRQVVYLTGLIAAFLLFSLVLRWQPWGSRLLLPLLVLAMPFEATLLGAYLRGRIILAPAAVLSLAAVPFLLANPSRSIVGSNSIFLKDRLHQYFANVPDEITAYQTAASAIARARCTDVGMVTRYDGREYLAWVTVRQQVAGARLEHILVRNQSNRYTDEAFIPCAIIVWKGLPDRTLAFRESAYHKVVHTDTLDLFLANMDPD